MEKSNWLGSQLDRAEQEVQSWNEWKRDAMRRQAASISVEREGSGKDTAEEEERDESTKRVPAYNS